MEQKYTNASVLSDLSSLQTRITRTEMHIKQAKLNIKEANRMLRNLKEHVTRLKELQDLLLIKNRGDLDIDALLSYYKTMHPQHRPYIYWKALIDMLSSIETPHLKAALKRHDCCKYVRWQLEPPKSKKKDETSCKHS